MRIQIDEGKGYLWMYWDMMGYQKINCRKSMDKYWIPKDVNRDILSYPKRYP
jgi:hypothetical protein